MPVTHDLLSILLVWIGFPLVSRVLIYPLVSLTRGNYHGTVSTRLGGSLVDGNVSRLQSRGSHPCFP